MGTGRERGVLEATGQVMDAPSSFCLTWSGRRRDLGLRKRTQGLGAGRGAEPAQGFLDISDIFGQKRTLSFFVILNFHHGWLGHSHTLRALVLCGESYWFPHAFIRANGRL